MAVVAVTGGTGFVGRHLIRHLVAQGHVVHALSRQPQPPQPGIVWHDGALEQPDSLLPWAAACDTVIHVAGAIKARRAEDFFLVNVEGTAHVLRAAAHGGPRRLVHLSSIVARQPQLSHYCRTKAEAETLVQSSGLGWTIVRPPGVYGPADRETLAFFRAARGAWLPCPAGNGVLSWVHIDDLCRAIIAAVDPRMAGKLLEVDDGGGGYTYSHFSAAVIEATGGRARLLPVPLALLTALGWGNQLAALCTGRVPMLTPGKVREITHPDWRVTDQRLQQQTGWTPQISLVAGLRATADWYLAHKWL